MVVFSGNNPTSVCELCAGSGEQKCTSSDPHAGFDGAFRCLNAGGDIAFLRHDTIMMSTLDTQVNLTSFIQARIFLVIIIQWVRAILL